jgi:hypothetical protein
MIREHCLKRDILALKARVGDDFLHFARAFVNLAHTHIAVVALDWEIAHIAVTASSH